MARESVGTERDPWGTGRSKGNAAASLWKAGQSKTYAQGPCCAPQPESCLLVPRRAGCWEVGFGE